jgi:hypothetical protein
MRSAQQLARGPVAKSRFAYKIREALKDTPHRALSSSSAEPLSFTSIMSLIIKTPLEKQFQPALVLFGFFTLFEITGLDPVIGRLMKEIGF